MPKVEPVLFEYGRELENMEHVELEKGW